MEENHNLELDFDRTRETAGVARVRVAMACSYTRDGEPTLSEDCGCIEELAREVERLKAELDAVVRAAADRFGADAGAPPAASGTETREAAATPPSGPAAARPGEALRVQDLMTREVRTLAPMDALSLAEELMRVGRFRHAVVVDEGGRLAGVVSQRDILFNALSWTLGQGRYAHEKALASIPAKEVMASDVVTVPPDAPLARAAGLMAERKIGCLPVMEGERLVGILTEADLLAFLGRSARQD